MNLNYYPETAYCSGHCSVSYKPLYRIPLTHCLIASQLTFTSVLAAVTRCVEMQSGRPSSCSASPSLSAPGLPCCCCCCLRCRRQLLSRSTCRQIWKRKGDNTRGGNSCPMRNRSQWINTPFLGG